MAMKLEEIGGPAQWANDLYVGTFRVWEGPHAGHTLTVTYEQMSCSCDGEYAPDGLFEGWKTLWETVEAHHPYGMALVLRGENTQDLPCAKCGATTIHRTNVVGWTVGYDCQICGSRTEDRAATNRGIAAALPPPMQTGWGDRNIDEERGGFGPMRERE